MVLNQTPWVCCGLAFFVLVLGVLKDRYVVFQGL